MPFFNSWGLELLVPQLYDLDKQVAMEAVEILDEACEEEVHHVYVHVHVLVVHVIISCTNHVHVHDYTGIATTCKHVHLYHM